MNVVDLDGAIAEVLRDGSVVGWLAVEAAQFRNPFLQKQIGCWLLFTWADGSVEVEEDYPPFALLPELMAGTMADGPGGVTCEIRWVEAARRTELWGRYGMHESPGHYMALAAQRGAGRG